MAFSGAAMSASWGMRRLRLRKEETRSALRSTPNQSDQMCALSSSIAGKDISTLCFFNGTHVGLAYRWKVPASSSSSFSRSAWGLWPNLRQAKQKRVSSNQEC